MCGMNISCVSDLEGRFPFIYHVLSSTDATDHAMSAESAACERGRSLVQYLSRATQKAAWYLGGYLHDSEVLHSSLVNNEFHIRLDDFSTHCLFDVLARHRGMTTDSCFGKPAPLDVMIRHVDQIDFFQLEEDQRFSRCDSNVLVPKSTWLYDDIDFARPEQFGLGLIFWTPSSDHILVALHARSIEFDEHQEESFVSLFGVECVDLFNAYWKARKRRSFDRSQIKDVLEGNSDFDDWCAPL
ncbi:MAG TPA: hypothetical protein VJZ71_17035 [Phycisphaerae bacterium]|nr:hypothetical protein [Phycisphaerae bacterium]